MQRHIEKPVGENLRYDVSEKHFETNFHINSAGVSLAATVMTPAHFGQTQDEGVGAISVDRIMGTIPSRWRQRSRDMDR